MSSLVSRAHNQIQAAKLHSLLTGCPLVLVYQTLGNVRSSGLAQAMNDQLASTSKPGVVSSSSLTASSVKIKNTIAAAAQGTSIAPFFQANNILVGWQLSHDDPPAKLVSASSSSPTASTSSPSAPALRKVSAARTTKRQTKLSEMLGVLSKDSTSSKTAAKHRPIAPSLPHPDLVKAIASSLKLQATQPIALLAGFYRGQHFRQSHLKTWMGLDEAKVMPELLAQLDSVADALCGSMDGHLDELVGTMDQLQPDDLLACLDAMSEKAQEETSEQAHEATSEQTPEGQLQ